jgi:hypothetical protein
MINEENQYYVGEGADLTPYIAPEWEARPVPLNQPAQDLESDFAGKYPNAYGVYGAAKEVLKTSLPYVKYIDPAEREKFMELTEQEQTRDLLFEALNAAVLGRWKPISKFAGEVGSAALETFLPKTAKVLYSEIPAASKILGNQRGAIGEKPPVAPKVESPTTEIVQSEATSQAEAATVDSTWSKVQSLSNDWEGIVETQRRGTRSHELAAKEAETIGMTLDDVKAIAPGTAMNDSQAVALVRTIKPIANESQSLAMKWVETKDPAYLDKSIDAFLAVGEANPARMGVNAEAGRTLSVLNDPISGENKYLDQFSEALKRSDLSKEQLGAMIATFKTEGDLAAAARVALKAGKIEAVMQLWVKGLLTGPPTQAANIMGNSLYLGIQAPERLLASAIGSVMPGTGEVAAGEAGAMIKGAVLGFRDAMRLAGKTYLNEDSQFSKVMGQASTSKMEIKSKMTEAFGEGWFGKSLQLYDDVLGYASTRPLMAGDDFFKSIGYRAELHALAIRETERLGLTGEAAAQKISTLINNPPEQFKTDALKFSQYITFQEELGPAGQGVMNIVNAVPPLRFVLPFVKTPANIFTGFVDRTPFAPFRQAVRDDIAAGGSKRDLAMARIGLGSMLAASTSAFVMDGMITGGGPSDKAQRAALLRTGWQPFSIKFGDKYYSYQRMEPIATIMGVTASATEIMMELKADDIDSDHIATAIVAAFSKNVTDKTFLQGITKLASAMSNPDIFGPAYINQLAGSVVPAIGGVVQRQIDPELKAVESMLDSIKSRIPGLADGLPPKRNLWGEAVTAQTLGPALVSPVRKSQAVNSPADEAIIENKINIEMPTKFLNGVQMTPEEYDRYVVLQGNELKSSQSGMGLRDTLDNMVSMPDYLRQAPGPDGGRALMIKQQVHAFREQAKAQMLMEFPDLMGAVQTHEVERQQARQPLY